MPDYSLLPFDEAIEFLRQKISIPSDRWDDIFDAEHDAAFVVAGARGSLLTQVRQLVTRGIERGQSTEDFQEEFLRLTEGWTGSKPWRANIIYDTNFRQAYAAGRYARQLDPEVLQLQPYLQWIHGDSRNPRLHHKALDLKVFRAEELPFYPPNGFGCRCRVISLSEKDIAEQGLTVETLKRGDLIQYQDPESGKMSAVRLNPEPGFERIPGQSREADRLAMRESILSRLDPVDRAWVRGEMAQISQQIRQERLGIQQPVQTGPDEPTDQVVDNTAITSAVEDPGKLAEALDVVESRLRYRIGGEVGIALDLDGTVLLEKLGGPNFVRITNDELVRMVGKVFTHNHPSGASFSLGDIEMLFLGSISELRAVGRDFRYSIKLPQGDDNLNKLLALRRIYNQVFDSVRKDFLSRKPQLSGQDVLDLHHEVITQVSDILELQYKREPW